MTAERPPSILFICTIPLTAQVFIAGLASYLERRGFTVAIACSTGGGAEGGRALDNLVQAGYRIIIVPIPRQARPLQDLRAVWALSRLLRRERFDLVHTQTAKAGFVGRAAARLAGTPVILHTAHAFPFHAGLPALLRWGYALLERWAARWTDLILVDTDAVRTDGLRHRVAPPTKIVTVHMGVDLARFDPNRVDRRAARTVWGIPDDAPVLGTVARLVPDKGVDVLLQAAARVRRAHPDLRLLIVGDGPLRASLEEMSRRLDLDGCAIFAGVRTDVPEQLAAMDVFALPTLREGFGVVFAEAMAMRTPVVGTDIGPVREVVADGETGFLVPPQDASRLAAAVTALLNDPPRRRIMGEAGRLRVAERFAAEVMFARTEAIYLRLLRAPSSHARA